MRDKIFCLLFVVIIGVVSITNTSCKEDCPDYVLRNKPPTQGVGGNWMLVKMRVVTTCPDLDSGWSKTETTDYSKDSIIYEFQYEKPYKKVDIHWTPKYKLIVYNCIPTGLLGDIQESGEYFYQFRQPGDSFTSDCLHIDYNCNLKIYDIDHQSIGNLWGFATTNFRTSVDIKELTDTMNIGTGQTGQYSDKSGNIIQWTKIFVRIKDGG